MFLAAPFFFFATRWSWTIIIFPHWPQVLFFATGGQDKRTGDKSQVKVHCSCATRIDVVAASFAGARLWLLAPGHALYVLVCTTYGVLSMQ